MVLKIKPKTVEGKKAINKLIDDYYNSGLTGSPFWWLDDWFVIVSTLAKGCLSRLRDYLNDNLEKHFEIKWV